MAALIAMALPGSGIKGTTGVWYEAAVQGVLPSCKPKKPIPTAMPAAAGEPTNVRTASLMASQREGGVGIEGFIQASSAAGHSIEPDLSCMMKTSVRMGVASKIVGM